MINKQLAEHSIIIAEIEYDDGTGSKRRPSYVVEYDGEILSTYKITTRYENKSEYIQSKYFEILDYLQAGLHEPSWIDTIKPYFLKGEKVQIQFIGYLSDRDEQRLTEFLSSGL